MRFIPAFLFLLLTLIQTSCSEGGLFSKKHEGVIIYDVTFPYAENSLMMELYPHELTLEFKDGLYHTTLKSAYGVISTEFIIDEDKGEFIQLLKSFDDRTYIRLTREQMPAWLAQYPSIRLEPTGKRDTIAGALCDITIGHLENDSVPSIELYSTSEMDLSPSNWWNQFSGLEGFLLGYDVEQYGKRMRLRAREIRYGPVSADRFLIPSDYIQITPEAMHEKIESIMADLLE